MRLSVIIPVYNSEPYIRKCLDSVLSQNENIQIICIDDGSDDGSREILSEYGLKHSCITVVEQSNQGAGAARNLGLKHAIGEYVHFLDSDDWMEDGAYRLILNRMMRSNVDVCIFQKYNYDNETGISRPIIKAFNTNCRVINLETNPSFLIHGPVVPWNKICRRSLIVENDLRFDEIVCANDRTFHFSLLMCAGSIMICKEPLVYYRTNNSKSLVGTTRSKHYDAHFCAFSSTMSSIDNSKDEVKMMVLDECLIDMFRFYDKASIIYKPKIYYQLNRFFNSMDQSLISKGKYVWKEKYDFIRKHKFGFLEFFVKDQFLRVKSKFSSKKSHWRRSVQTSRDDVIISVTTFPERIQTIHIALKSIIKQTVKPYKIILWLANEQFPDGESELPDVLLNLKEKGLEIRFCEDLKPHKKYFYTMLEYPEKIVITVDDDVVYDDDLVETLLKSYDRHPNAISAMRVHRITIRDGMIEPYSSWIFNDEHFFDNPSMYAIATGVGGVLYPPHSIPLDSFDKEAIKSTCLFGDDLWLKANELRNNVPTALASLNRKLNYIDGTQEMALWADNIAGGRNDSQLSEIKSFFKKSNWGNIEELMISAKSPMLSVIIDCNDAESFTALQDLKDSLPDWAEMLIYLDYDEKSIGLLRELFPFDSKVRIVFMKNYSIPLHTLVSASYGRYLIFADPWIFTYNSDFFGIVKDIMEQPFDIANNKVIADYFSVDATDETFNPFYTPFLKGAVSELHVKSLKDKLSRKYVSNLLFGDLDLTCDVEDIIPEEYSYSEIISILSDDAFNIDIEEKTGQKILNNIGIYPGDPGTIEEFDSRSKYDTSPLSMNYKLCPACGVSPRYFITGGSKTRDDVECPVCGSWERHRSAWAFTQMVERPVDSEIAAVNFPSKMRKTMIQNGIIPQKITDIIESKKQFSVIILCHSLKTESDVQSIKELSNALMNDGLIYVSISIKKSNGMQTIENLNIPVNDFIMTIRDMGLDVSYLTNRDVFEEQVLDIFSIIPNEAFFVIKKKSE